MEKEIILYGEWYIPDTEERLPGELHINEEEKHIYLVLTRLCSEQNPMASIKARGNVAIIKGKINTGGSILLYNCHFQGQHTTMFQRTQVAVGIEYAFWNLEKCDSVEELRFPKVSVDYGEILEWASLCSFEHDWEKEGISFEWKSDEKIELMIAEGKSIIITPSFGSVSSSMSRTKEIKLSQKIDVQFVYQSPEKWDNILKDISIFKNLLSLGMDRSIYIDGIDYYHESHRMEEYPDIIREMKIFCGRGQTGHHKSGYWMEYLFTLKDLRADDNKCLSKWFEKYKRLKPVVELSTSAFNYVDISVEMLFLNLVQGLETYHARFVSDKPKEYYKIVDEMLLSIYDAESLEKLPERAMASRAFMITEKNEHTATRILLRSRLGFLFYLKNEIWTGFFGYSREEFVTKVVDTRNYLTHYAEQKEDKIFSEQEFPYVNGLLMVFLQYYIMLEIGISIEKAQETIRKGIININRAFDEDNRV